MLPVGREIGDFIELRLGDNAINVANFWESRGI
jgi:hypothetical protein